MDFKNLVVANYELHSFVDLFGLVPKTPSNMAWFAMTCWLIWNRRNKVHVHQLMIPLDRIAFFACDHLAKFHKFHNKAPKKARLAKKIWNLPDASKAKANFDRAHV